MPSTARFTAALLALLFAAGCSDESTTPGGGALPGPTAPPLPAEPALGSGGEYLVEIDRWGISADGTNPTETTDRLNQAIAWAAENGYARARSR